MSDLQNTNTTLVTGGAQCGKTQYLCDQVQHLHKDALTATDSVLVLCATPQAAICFSERLVQLGIEATNSIRVTTPRAIALEILGEPQSQALTGREPRLLLNYEENFLMEDMKTSGLRPKRLREMLKFFYRSWTELADDDPEWLLKGEETSVHELLKANLDFTRSLLEPEVSNFAVRCLRELDDLQAKWNFDHVLVDDYELITRASQVLAGLLATKSLTVAGDADACITAFEAYPYPEGLKEFVATYPNCTQVTLDVCHACTASAKAAKNLLAADPALTGQTIQLDPEACDGEVVTCAVSTPPDEFDAIVDQVRSHIEAGIEASAVTVAVPNNSWARNIAGALHKADIAAEILPDKQPIHGDIREYDKCIPARVMTALKLVADPNNAIAWRCWCGFGDYLVRSSSFTSLRELAAKKQWTLLEALEQVNTAFEQGSAEELLGQGVVGLKGTVEAYRQGLALLESTQGLEGNELLEAIVNIVTGEDHNAAKTIPGAITLLCQPSVAPHDASSMATRAQQAALFPTLHKEDTVAVVPYHLVAGMTPDVLIISGFVNGFIPISAYFDGAEMSLEKQLMEHSKDTRLVYQLASKATRELIVSYFTSADLESASMLKLKIERIRLRNGKSVCTLSPSIFLEEIIK